MAEPRKTKTINGVEYGYCGNHCTNGRYRILSFRETPEEAAEHEAAWLANAVLLPPEPTDTYTTEQLLKNEMVSVWKPMSTLPPD